jgi:tetratricopeptide (TPR) repeat protein
MTERLDPMLDSLTTVEEIGNIYQNLIDASTWAGEGDKAAEYQEEMVDRLVTLLDTLTTKEEIVFVNQTLGNTELYLGRNQFAAVYYRRVAEQYPTAGTTYMVSQAYYFGGNHECTYYWFQKLLALDDPAVEIYREIAEEAMEFVEEIESTCEDIICCP